MQAMSVWEMINDNDGSVRCTLCVDLNRENGYETAVKLANRIDGVRSDYMTWDQVQALRNR